MTRAAIYARYSTDNQSPRSVADQIALCEAHADRLGHVVVARYSDAATSGQIINRPGFAALMKAARLPPETRPFDVLIVESADRLSRHAGDIHHIRDAFAFAEVPVLQVEGGELDAMKAAVSGLVSSLSIKSTIEKTIRGMSAKAHIVRLEARKGELVALVAAAEAAERPVFLFSGAVARFREQLSDMAENIPEAAGRGHSGPQSAFRRLVASVTVHPNYELEIAGDLAPLLGVSMVAGDRLERNPQTPPDSIPFIIKAAA